MALLVYIHSLPVEIHAIPRVALVSNHIVMHSYMVSYCIDSPNVQPHHLIYSMSLSCLGGWVASLKFVWLLESRSV